MDRPPIPLVFLFGPSGAGKSTLSEELSRQDQWLAIETDPSSERFGASLANAVLETLSRLLPIRFAGLAHELHRLAAPQHAGLIVSFASTYSPSLSNIRALEAQQVRIVYLFAQEAECLRAFLERESRTGRGLTATYWQEHNARIYSDCLKAAYQPYKLHAFEEGVRRPVREVAAELVARTAREM